MAHIANRGQGRNIVFGADPVRLGLVASLNRSGGNVRGVTILTNSLAAKWVGLPRDLAGKPEAVGFLVHSRNLNIEVDKKDVQAAVNALGVRLIIADEVIE